jgi:hypothetical protein
MLKIDFSFDTNYGVFRDALYLPENHSLAPAEIDELKKQRLDAWVYAVENPPLTNEEDGVLDESFVPPTDEVEQ